MLGANTSIGSVLILLIVAAVVIYGIAFIAGKGAKRGGRS